MANLRLGLALLSFLTVVLRTTCFQGITGRARGRFLPARLRLVTHHKMVAHPVGQSTAADDAKHLAFLSDVLSEINEKFPDHWDRLYGRMTFMKALEKLSLRPSNGRVERVLQYMLEARNERIGLTPDRMCYNLALKSLSQKPDLPKTHSESFFVEAGKASYELLRQWRVLYKDGIVLDYADSISYNTVLNTLSRDGSLIGLLEEVVAEREERQTENPELAPDTYFYGAQVSAYARLGDTEKIQSILHHMQQRKVNPTIHILNSSMTAYVSSRKGKDALSFLNRWIKASAREPREQESFFTVPPNTRSYNIALSALGNDITLEEAKFVFSTMGDERDSVSYLTFLGFICQKLSPSSEAIVEAQEVLKEAYADPNVRVGSKFVASAIRYISTIENIGSPDLAEKMVSICLNDDIKLNIEVYEALVECWAKSRNKFAAERVLEILDEVHQSKNLSPTQRMVSNVLYALSYQNVQDAERIYNNLHNFGVQPNAVLRVNMIRCYCQSNLLNKAPKAMEVLRSLGDDTSIVACNFVLKACEYTIPNENNTKEALDIACEVFTSVLRSESMTPNHYTFSHFIASLGNLVPDATAKKDAIKLVFLRCCQDGLVSRDVIQKFNFALSRDQEKTSNLDITSIPAEWSRNLPKEEEISVDASASENGSGA